MPTWMAGANPTKRNSGCARPTAATASCCHAGAWWRVTRADTLRVVGTLTDLTQHRQAERERLELERVEAASRAKLAVLAHVSHDLRTPLNAVLGFAQLLRDDLGTADVERQREFLAAIERAGWELLDLIERMLHVCEREA